MSLLQVGGASSLNVCFVVCDETLLLLFISYEVYYLVLAGLSSSKGKVLVQGVSVGGGATPPH